MNKMLKNMLLLLTAAMSFGVVSAEDNCACGCENKEAVEAVFPAVEAEQVQDMLPVEEAVEQKKDVTPVVDEVAPVQEVTAEDVAK